MERLNQHVAALQEVLARTEQVEQAREGEWVNLQEREICRFFLHRVELALAARDAWLEYLTQKYGLQPGDEITPEGQILRHHSAQPQARVG
jgi:hypothetical protein